MVIGCNNVKEKVEFQETGIEELGGKYNLTLSVIADDKGNTMKKIKYVKDGEEIDPDQILPDEMRPGLDWLKLNTLEDSVVMTWWDYGHAIRAYGERESVVDAPSKKILTTTVAKHMGKSPGEVECPGCVPHEIIYDVASLLLAEDETEAVKIMEKYGASFLYVHVDDESKAMAFFIALDEEPMIVSDRVLGKALREELRERFELVYSDSVARIYELK